ncbi:MAG: DNA recombination protein RmuC [Synergistaceae bacterium]|jgi:DNA recombination protein RmuC|nr:DNA recombination protein RmuC [Synergistaceae bacterium]
MFFAYAVAVGVLLVALTLAAALFLRLGRLGDAVRDASESARLASLKIESLDGRLLSAERASRESSESLREMILASEREQRGEISRSFMALGETQSNRMRDIAEAQRSSLDLMVGQLAQLTMSTEAKLDSLRGAVEERLREIQCANEQKLDKMRELVGEKLHSTLEQRLGVAFSNVSEWLDKVHRGLGEMKNLAGDVGDLRKVLTNVKTRGTWGEIQLGALLEQVLHRDQYERNVAVKPGSQERVEFAVKLPGQSDGDTVWLPIDSKFPQEDYLRVVESSERADAAALAESRKALERRVLEEAKKIRGKYIEAPYTTDFGILFLPVEGLYSEVLRIDGLAERIMREYRVVMSGPTTVAALLNSLQMGFRTLAVEKRSSEVWVLLGQVKTEFAKFGDILDKTRSRIELAGRELEGAGKRTRAIERRLRDVADLPSDSLSQELDALDVPDEGPPDA